MDKAEIQKLAKEYEATSKDGRYPEGTTALFIACDWGKTEVLQYLIDEGTDVNAQNEAGFSALHFVAANDYCKLECAKILIAAGADINLLAGEGMTPLHWAASIGAEDKVKFLLDAGADATLSNHDGNTALAIARVSSEENGGDTHREVKAMLEAVAPEAEETEVGALPWGDVVKGAQAMREESLDGSHTQSFSDGESYDEQVEKFIQLAGFITVSMAVYRIFYFLYNRIPLAIEYGFDWVRDIFHPLAFTNLIGMALLAMVARGILKRDEYWGLWGGFLLIASIFVTDYIVLPIYGQRVDIPMGIANFHFSMTSVLYNLFPFALAFLLIKPLVAASSDKYTSASIVGKILWHPAALGSGFAFGFLCVAVLTFILAILFPHTIGIIMIVLGVLGFMDVAGPTKVTAYGSTQAEADANLQKELDKSLWTWLVPIALVIYGLMLKDL